MILTSAARVDRARGSRSEVTAERASEMRALLALPRRREQRGPVRPLREQSRGPGETRVMPKAVRWFALAAAIVLVDQMVKWLVLAPFAPGERCEVTGFFNLVLVFNKGAAFSFLADAPGWQTPLSSAFALLAARSSRSCSCATPGRRSSARDSG